MSNLKKQFEQVVKEIEAKTPLILEDHARRINYQQKRKSPVNYGFLRQNNGFTINGQKAEIFNNAEYAPFVEFGTKTKVKVPAGFEKMANEFKGKKGSFEEFKEDIKEWCRRKGIEDMWYPVMLKILRVGINPQPFFIQPFLEGKEKYLKDIKKLVNEVRW